MKSKIEDTFDLESDMNEEINLYDKIPIHDSVDDTYEESFSGQKEKDKNVRKNIPREKKGRLDEKSGIGRDEGKTVSNGLIRIQPYIEDELYIRLKIYLIRNRMSLSSFIRNLIVKFMNEYEKK